MTKKEKQNFSNWIHLTTFEESDYDSDEFEHHITKPFLHETAKYRDPENLEKEAEFMSEEKDADSEEEDDKINTAVASIKATIKAMHAVIQHSKEKGQTKGLAQDFMNFVKQKATNEYVFEDPEKPADEGEEGEEDDNKDSNEDGKSVFTVETSGIKDAGKTSLTDKAEVKVEDALDMAFK